MRLFIVFVSVRAIFNLLRGLFRLLWAATVGLIRLLTQLLVPSAEDQLRSAGRPRKAADRYPAHLIEDNGAE